MPTRNTPLTAATLLAGATLAAASALATSGEPSQRPAPSNNHHPSAWLGLPVMASDGHLVGIVSEHRQSLDQRPGMLIVRSADDGQVFAVPAGIAAIDGRTVKLKASAAEIGKRT